LKSTRCLYIGNPDSRKSNGRRPKRLAILLLAVLILLGMGVDAVLAQVADLQVTKTVNDSTPDESQLITYTINVRNDGPDDATGVTILDLLPAGISFDSIDTIQPTGATYDPITGIWDIGTIPEGTNYDLKLDVSPDVGTAGSTIANTASVSSLN